MTRFVRGFIATVAAIGVFGVASVSAQESMQGGGQGNWPQTVKVKGAPAQP